MQNERDRVADAPIPFFDVLAIGQCVQINPPGSLGSVGWTVLVLAKPKWARLISSSNHAYS